MAKRITDVTIGNPTMTSVEVGEPTKMMTMEPIYADGFDQNISDLIEARMNAKKLRGSAPMPIEQVRAPSYADPENFSSTETDLLPPGDWDEVFPGAYMDFNRGEMVVTRGKGAGQSINIPEGSGREEIAIRAQLAQSGPFQEPRNLSQPRDNFLSSMGRIADDAATFQDQQSIPGSIESLATGGPMFEGRDVRAERIRKSKIRKEMLSRIHGMKKDELALK